MLKFLLIDITFGANVDKNKLLSIGSEKNMLCLGSILNE